MAGLIIQKFGLDDYPDSMKVTLIKVASGIIKLCEISDEEIEKEEKLEKIKNEIKTQRTKLLEKYDKKEITPTEFAGRDLLFSKEINEYELKLQEIKKVINTKKFKKQRMELIQTILALDLKHNLGIMEKYKLKFSLYDKLCNEIIEETLTTLNHDVNMIRLNKYLILATKEENRTTAQNSLLNSYTNLLCELQNEIDMIKKLQQSHSIGDLGALKFDILADADITRIIHKVFPEELYTSKKRAV